MIFHIKKGNHYCRPLRIGFWWGRNQFEWKVKFSGSCRYILDGIDQEDTNKLIGPGYLRGWFRPSGVKWWQLWKYHHKDSARFGWRYAAEKDSIEVSAYCYLKGRRVIRHLAYCEIGKEYDLHLKILSTCYYLAVHEHKRTPTIGSEWIDHIHNKYLQYRLGIYFGGNKVAPHDITIELSKL